MPRREDGLMSLQGKGGNLKRKLTIPTMAIVLFFFGMFSFWLGAKHLKLLILKEDVRY